jgi:hypothetical protein
MDFALLSSKNMEASKESHLHQIVNGQAERALIG